MRRFLSISKYLLLFLLLVAGYTGKGQEYIDFTTGYGYYQAGDFDSAIKYFDKSIKENPNHGDSYYFKGLLLGRQGHLKEALPLFNKAIAINPSDGAYYGDRGVVYANMGKDKEALNDFVFAAKFDSLNPARHFNLAAYYLNRHQCDRAIQYLDNCLQVDADHLKARFKRATCFVTLNRRDEAIEDYTYVIQHYKDQSTALNPYDYNELLGYTYYMRGGIYGEAGEYEKSVADLKEAITYKKDNPEIYNSLGYYMIFTGDVKNAIPYLDKSIEMEPSTHNYNSRAFAYYKLGEFTLAEKDALEAKEMDDSYDETYYNLALIYNRMEKFTESCKAKKMAEKLGSAKAKDLQIKGCK